MLRSDKIKFAKIVAKFIVGSGTSHIVASTVKNNVPMETAYHKVCVYSASTVIGAMASDATKKFTDRAVDDAVKVIDTIKEEYETKKNS